MIDMPESYESICRKRGTVAETMYTLPYKQSSNLDWFEEANSSVQSHSRGVFHVYYALRSYPRATDNTRYWLMFITNSGIFRSSNSHCFFNEPIDFRTMEIRRIGDFGPYDMLTLLPHTRQITILKEYRYTELINGSGVPNVWYWYDHPEVHKDAKTHQILLESRTTMPILTEFRDELYQAVRLGKPYLYLRSDNYVPIDQVRFDNNVY